MKNGEKLFWLAVAGYSAYSAGRLFVDQYETVEREGSTPLNVVVLTCIGVAFLVRLDSARRPGARIAVLNREGSS